MMYLPHAQHIIATFDKGFSRTKETNGAAREARVDPMSLRRIRRGVERIHQIFNKFKIWQARCHGKVKDIYGSKELWTGPESIYRKEGVLALSGDTQ
jgi:hypothetical protein